jgi:transcriptional activator of cad operon
MDQPRTLPFCVGAWFVEPASCQISRDGEVVRLDARSMRLLQCLASRAGNVVSIDDLLDQVWPGVIVTSDSVYQAVTSLRRSLGDDPKQSVYIATVPRLGYRMVAEVRESSPTQVSVQPVMVASPAETKGRLAAFMHRRRRAGCVYRDESIRHGCGFTGRGNVRRRAPISRHD